MSMRSTRAMRSANRNSRVDSTRPRTGEVSSPVGAHNSTTASDQASALRRAYGAGGFEGVAKEVGPQWYDIPEWQRTQILRELSGQR